MDKSSIALNKAKKRFEYWHGQDAAKELYAGIADLPTDRQVEMIYREMEYQESLAPHAQAADLYAIGMGV